LALGASVAGADVVAPVVARSASHGGDQYGTGPVSLTDGSGMDQSVDPTDPSTWECVSNHYNQEWMAQFFPPLDADIFQTAALNSKLAWVSFDFGSSMALDNMYLWNIRYGGGVAGTESYNLYYTDSPSVTLPAEPNKGSWSNTGLTPQGDYELSGGGWTKFNTVALTLGKSSDGSVSLSGISARYIAIEIIENWGDTYKGGRVGFSEVAFSMITPPSGTMIFMK